MLFRNMTVMKPRTRQIFDIQDPPIRWLYAFSGMLGEVVAFQLFFFQFT